MRLNNTHLLFAHFNHFRNVSLYEVDLVIHNKHQSFGIIVLFRLNQLNFVDVCLAIGKFNFKGGGEIENQVELVSEGINCRFIASAFNQTVHSLVVVKELLKKSGHRVLVDLRL